MKLKKSVVINTLFDRNELISYEMDWDKKLSNIRNAQFAKECYGGLKDS